MSNLRVNSLVNENNDGPVTFTKGLSIGSNKTIIADNVVVSGIVTATYFYGTGTFLTNLPGVSNGKGIALALII